MISKSQRTASALDIFLSFLIFYAPAAGLIYVCHKSLPSCLLASILIVPYMVTVWLSRLKGRFLIFLLCELIFIALPLGLAPAIEDKLIYAGFFIIVFLFFLVKRLRTTSDLWSLELSPWVFLWFAALALVLPHFEGEAAAPLMVILGCLYLIGCCLNIYLHHTVDFLQNNKHLSNLPARYILKSGTVMMGGFTLIGVLIMMLFSRINLNRFFDQLKLMLVAFLRWIESLSSTSDDTTAIVETVVETQDNTMSIMTEETAASPIMAAISEFIMHLLTVILVLAAIAAVIYGIYVLYQRYNGFFRGKRSARKVVEETDVIENIETGKRRSRRLNFALHHPPEDRLRRLYYKKVQKSVKKEKIHPAMTPDELTKAMNPADPDAALKLTQLYQKARYSDLDISSVDIENAKNAARQLKSNG